MINIVPSDLYSVMETVEDAAEFKNIFNTTAGCDNRIAFLDDQSHYNVTLAAWDIE